MRLYQHILNYSSITIKSQNKTIRMNTNERVSLANNYISGHFVWKKNLYNCLHNKSTYKF